MTGRIIGLGILLVGLTGGGYWLLNGDEGDDPSSARSVADVLGETNANDSHDHTADHDHQDIPEISDTGPWPEVETSELSFSFGRMQIGQEMEHRFTIRNTGDAVLELAEGESTCKCTLFRLDRHEVPPGESAELLIRWQGKNRDPTFRHGGPVFTNDPNNDVLNFRVEGLVDYGVEFLPQIWNVGSLAPGKGGTLEAAVISRTLHALSSPQFTPESDHVRFEVRPLTVEEMASEDVLCGYQVMVHVSPDIPPGFFQDKVSVAVDQMEAAGVVTVEAVKEGFIRIQPTTGVQYESKTRLLSLGQFPARNGNSVKLLLLIDQTGMEEDLVLEEAICTPSLLKTEFQPMGVSPSGTGRYMLTLSVPPGKPRTERSSSSPATITLRFNHPQEPELTLKAAFRSF